MRENRTSGSEGGGTEPNRSFLPLSSVRMFKKGNMTFVEHLRKTSCACGTQTTDAVVCATLLSFVSSRIVS